MNSPTASTRSLDLATLQLGRGSHDHCDQGYCLYEAYNWLTREEYTDDCPPDVSLVLHEYGMRLNDALPDGARQELKRFLPSGDGPSPLSGTRRDGLDEARSYMALDWLIRTYMPAWLDLVGLTVEAQALRDLRRIVDLTAAEDAGLVVRVFQRKTVAVWDAAWAAAPGAVWSDVWAEAGPAARAAAGDAARVAASVAKTGAARVAASVAAAEDAVLAAAGSVILAAGEDKLHPTVGMLQGSAIDLFTAMIRPEVA